MSTTFPEAFLSFEELLNNSILDHFKKSNIKMEDKNRILILSSFKSIINIEVNLARSSSSKKCVAQQTNLCKSNKDAINSHTVPQNQLKLLVPNNNHKVLSMNTGLLAKFKSKFRHSHDIFPTEINKASSFHGFCSDCESLFGKNNLDSFDSINEKNFLFFCYRYLSRDLALSINSIEEYNKFLVKIESDLIKSNFWRTYLFSNQKTAYEVIHQATIDLSFNINFMKMNIASLLDAHYNKKTFNNGSALTILSNYDYIHIETDLKGFCVGVASVPVYVGFYEGSTTAEENIKTYHYVIFGIQNNKQSLKIYIHKRDRSAIEAHSFNEKKLFFYYLFHAIASPLPNIYFSPSMSKNIDFILEKVHLLLAYKIPTESCISALLDEIIDNF